MAWAGVPDLDCHAAEVTRQNERIASLEAVIKEMQARPAAPAPVVPEAAPSGPQEAPQATPQQQQPEPGSDYRATTPDQWTQDQRAFAAKELEAFQAQGKGKTLSLDDFGTRRHEAFMKANPSGVAPEAAPDTTPTRRR